MIKDLPPEELMQLRILKKILKDKHVADLLEDNFGYNKILLSSWVYTIKHVPLVHIGRVSRLLKVSPYVLNYKQVFDFYGKGPSFQEILKECTYFSNVEKTRILSGDEA